MDSHAWIHVHACMCGCVQARERPSCAHLHVCAYVCACRRLHWQWTTFSVLPVAVVQFQDLRQNPQANDTPSGISFVPHLSMECANNLWEYVSSLETLCCFPF